MKACLSILLALIFCMSVTAFADVRRGDKGEEVRKVQQQLADLGYLSGSVDGDFGRGTEKAIKAFQAAQGLPETGVVDAATQQMMDELLNPVVENNEPMEETTAAPSPEVTVEETQAPAKSEASVDGIDVSVRSNWFMVWPYALLQDKAPNFDLALGYAMDADVFIPVAVSWTNEPLIYETDDNLSGADEAWNAACSGNTVFFMKYSSKNIVVLPDDPSISGEQEINWTFGDKHVITKWNLTYKGSYSSDDGGWEAIPVSAIMK